jgi:hypothetical protein
MLDVAGIGRFACDITVELFWCCSWLSLWSSSLVDDTGAESDNNNDDDEHDEADDDDEADEVLALQLVAETWQLLVLLLVLLPFSTSNGIIFFFALLLCILFRWWRLFLLLPTMATASSPFDPLNFDTIGTEPVVEALVGSNDESLAVVAALRLLRVEKNLMMKIEQRKTMQGFSQLTNRVWC